MSRLIGDSYQADPTDLEELRKLAKRLDESKSALIRRAVKEFLRSSHTFDNAFDTCRKDIK